MRNLLLALFVTTALLCGIVRAQVPATTPPRTVTVSGTSTVYVAPDQAQLQIGVTSQSRHLDDARNEASKTAAEVLSAIRKQGIEEKDIQTNTLQVQMIRDYGKSSISEGTSFVATRLFRVTLRDIRKTDALYDAVVSAGANTINGPTYESSQYRQHRDEALHAAIRAAQQKAQLMASDLGVTVGTVRSVREISEPVSMPMAANSFQNAGGVGQTTDAPPGQVVIRGSVEVVFDLDVTR